jgi:mRNA interferase MazF
MVKQGDIIEFNFAPMLASPAGLPLTPFRDKPAEAELRGKKATLGHERSGYRLAVVVSNDFAITKTNVVYVAPITNSTRRFPLHVGLDARTQTTGEILCEQVKAVDLSARTVTFVEHLPADILEEVLTRIIGCFDA